MSNTVRSVGTSKFNFGPASSRDEVLYTAERPGNPPSKTDKVSNEAVDEWIAFMKDQGVKNVVTLLDDNEFGNYGEPGLLKMYANADLKCLHQPMKAEGALKNIIDFIHEASSKGEKVVAHCTGGVGRAGRVAAGWLVTEYGLSPQDATNEVMEHARKCGLSRKGDVQMLQDWLDSNPQIL